MLDLRWTLGGMLASVGFFSNFCGRYLGFLLNVDEFLSGFGLTVVVEVVDVVVDVTCTSGLLTGRGRNASIFRGLYTGLLEDGLGALSKTSFDFGVRLVVNDGCFDFKRSLKCSG